MLARNEVVVDRIEFKRAVGWVPKGRDNISDQTFLCLDDDGFTVVTPQAVTKVKSSGRWEIPVAIPAAVLKRWVNAFPKTKEITIVFSDGWLCVGARKISAAVVGADLLKSIFED